MNQMVTTQKRSLVDSMAAKYEMEPAAFMGAVKATCIKGECSNEQFAAFLMVAKEYDLNPLTKEIYAFPDRGGITPIVSIDGWMKLINSHPQFDGMEFVDNMGDDGKLHSVECKMYRKDRQRSTTVIEYMSECFRQTDPWKKWPNRMLRHKAAIQCARYAFGFSGIMEPDEYERMKDVTPSAQPNVIDRLKQAKEATTLDAQPVEGFSHDFIHAETESHPTGSNEDFSDDEPTLDLSPADDAERLPASTEEAGGDDTPASAPSASSGPSWLVTAAKMLWAATNTNGDAEENLNLLNNQRKAVGEIMPKYTDQPTKDRAGSIYTRCKAVVMREIEMADAKAIIAGIAGITEKDLSNG